MMKKVYEVPEMETVKFETEDCITNSNLPDVSGADVVDGNDPNL